MKQQDGIDSNSTPHSSGVLHQLLVNGLIFGTASVTSAIPAGAVYTDMVRRGVQHKSSFGRSFLAMLPAYQCMHLFSALSFPVTTSLQQTDKTLVESKSLSDIVKTSVLCAGIETGATMWHEVRSTRKVGQQASLPFPKAVYAAGVAIWMRNSAFWMGLVGAEACASHYSLSKNEGIACSFFLGLGVAGMSMPLTNAVINTISDNQTYPTAWKAITNTTRTQGTSALFRNFAHQSTILGIFTAGLFAGEQLLREPIEKVLGAHTAKLLEPSTAKDEKNAGQTR